MIKKFVVALLCAPAAFAQTWKTGSVTFYGNAMAPYYDPYPLAIGTCSCQKARDYNICYNNWCFDSISDPKMVGAAATPGLENTRLCGKCVEIRCAPGKYRGLSYSEFGSPNVCYSSKGKSIVITIVDSCPAGHSNPSNKKYCNYYQSMHFDLAYWAFKNLADPKFGVVDVDYRFVNCPVDKMKAFGVKQNTCCNGNRQCVYGTY